MPVGLVIDLLWRLKCWLVYLGSTLIAASLLILVGLLSNRDAMTAIMSAEAWYVLCVVLGPVG